MRRLLPLWLCLLALVATQLYGQQNSLKQDDVVIKHKVAFFASPTSGGTIDAVYFDDNFRMIYFQSGDSVPENSVPIFTAKANDGYKLKKWVVNGEDVKLNEKRPNDCKVVVQTDLRVEAVFEDLNATPQKTYALTLTPSEGGKIVAKADGTEITDLTKVAQGTRVTIEATPDAGYKLTKLTANGEDILKDKTFTVTKDTEVVAEFVDHTGIDAVVANAFVIYPNPAREAATVTGLAPEAAVALYTLDGQLITRLAADRSGRLQIDLTALSEGTYLVVTEGAAQRLVVKH